MPGKYLTAELKASALALLKEGLTPPSVAARLGVSANTIRRLKKRFEEEGSQAVPAHRPIPGRPRITSSKTDALMKRTVMKEPFLSASALINRHRDLLGHVSQRTIQHRLQKELGLPSRRAAKKPYLTSRMRRKRLDFCARYGHWTKEDWSKVLFSDESTFQVIRSSSRRVRRPQGVSRYHPLYTVKTVKHPPSVMVWGCFSGKGGRGSLYFLPSNEVMNTTNYVKVLRSKMLVSYGIHQSTHFLHDSAPCHRSLRTMNFLATNHVRVIEWPGNSPDLNPIENCWLVMKEIIAKERPASLDDLKKSIRWQWCHLSKEYLKTLAESMPSRIRKVRAAKGWQTKY